MMKISISLWIWKRSWAKTGILSAAKTYKMVLIISAAVCLLAAVISYYHKHNV